MLEPRKINIEKQLINMWYKDELIFQIRAYYCHFDDGELRIDGVYVMPLATAFNVIKKGTVLEIRGGQLIASLPQGEMILGKVKCSRFLWWFGNDRYIDYA